MKLPKLVSMVVVWFLLTSAVAGVSSDTDSYNNADDSPHDCPTAHYGSYCRARTTHGGTNSRGSTYSRANSRSGSGMSERGRAISCGLVLGTLQDRSASHRR